MSATDEQREQMLRAMAELARRPPRQRAEFAARSGVPPQIVAELMQQARAWGLRVAEEGEPPAPEDDGGAALAEAAEAAGRAGAAGGGAGGGMGGGGGGGVSLGAVAGDAVGRAWLLAYWALVPAAVAVLLYRRGMTLMDLYRSLSREFLA